MEAARQYFATKAFDGTVSRGLQPPAEILLRKNMADFPSGFKGHISLDIFVDSKGYLSLLFFLEGGSSKGK